MARRLFLFEDPDRVVIGTTGLPGSRTFYLQVREGQAAVSVVLEKAQVAALSERLGELLTAAIGAGIVHLDPTSVPDERPIDEPLVELFRAGALTIGFDGTSGRVTIEVRPVSEDGQYPEVDDQDPDGPDLMRIGMGAAQARGFVERAASILAAGRPTCPFCGQPLEPSGHFCPRMNGHLN
jgi:uncharacterized repeat protein (TIGR03847 family)